MALPMLTLPGGRTPRTRDLREDGSSPLVFPRSGKWILDSPPFVVTARRPLDPKGAELWLLQLSFQINQGNWSESRRRPPRGTARNAMPVQFAEVPQPSDTTIPGSFDLPWARCPRKSV